MLLNSLELVVQYPEPNGYRCRGFRGLRLLAPVYAVFDGAALTDQGVANSLGQAFCAEILRYVGAAEEGRMPCSGFVPGVSCHAVSEPSCRKILVRVVAGSRGWTGPWLSPSAEATWLANWPQPTWEVIPVMPTGLPVTANLPSQWQGINVCFWKKYPAEVLWAVLQRVGLAPEDSRLFISYVRRDTAPVADQLFGALTQEGFDVFLDRCSVPIGVQFQEHLMQDLCDKAMVVLLNSPKVSSSYWIQEEIAVVKSYRLGLLELRFPESSERLDIDPDFVEQVIAGDLIPAETGYATGATMLSTVALANVVDRIKEIHGRALHRRRYELIDNFAAALTAAGKTAQALPDGTFLLPASGPDPARLVGLISRLPELGDFCFLHQRGGVSPSQPGWLISPSPFFLAHREAQVSWLGGLSNIKHINEAQMTQLAASL